MLKAIINFFKPKCCHDFRSISQYTGRYTKYGVNKAISKESNIHNVGHSRQYAQTFANSHRLFEVITTHSCKKCDHKQTEAQWVITKGPKGSLYKKR